MAQNIKINENAKVYVRIRPENQKEKKSKLKSAEKFLENYDEKSVIIGCKKSPNKIYTYPKCVLGPNCLQEQAYEIMNLDKILEDFLFGHGYDGFILAYGQTGSGKVV